MQLQPVVSSLFADPFSRHPSPDSQTTALTDGNQGFLHAPPGNTVRLNSALESEYLTDEKFLLQYTSKDGDTVTLSMESLRYQKTELNIDAQGNADDVQKLIDYITKQFSDMRDQMLKNFMEKLNGAADDTRKTDGTGKTGEFAVPDYWNAENTSQRILDFATQFFSSFKGAGEDFVKMVREAIDKGFRQARDFLGDLPDEVSKLVSDTYDLLMKKLDEWARQNGISIDDSGTPDETTVPRNQDVTQSAAVTA